MTKRRELAKDIAITSGSQIRFIPDVNKEDRPGKALRDVQTNDTIFSAQSNMLIIYSSPISLKARQFQTFS